MKKTIFLTLAAAFVCPMLLFSACASSPNYSSGQISDFDFENGLGKFWTYTENSVTIDTDKCFGGEKSLKIGSDREYEAEVSQHINGLDSGYYYLEVETLNDGQDYCYVYGKGTAQNKCMTAVPRTIRGGEWIKVTVRGIKVESDGILEIGVQSKGNNRYVNFDNFTLKREVNQNKQFEMLTGGCISWLDWIEDLGGKYYYSDGTEGDALQIVADSGFNFVRLELYNNPGDYVNAQGETFPSGYKNADSIFDLAVRARDKGMKIQLSFMYSDYWGNEAIPSDWLAAINKVTNEAEKTEILTDCIYNFTKNYMQRLADAGIYPSFVSLGNEMECGILTPYGSTVGTKQQLNAFCKFMDAGYRAVKEVSPSSEIVLHIACNADDMFWENKRGTGRWFFDLCKENNVKYDVIGTSFYPFWAQTDNKYALKKALEVSDFKAWCDMMTDTYDKDVLIMETAINWGKPGQLANNGAYEGIYPYSPAGQKDYMCELLNAVKSAKNGRCVGVLYWDPVLVRQDGAGYAIDAASGKAKPNCVETTTFFDYNHIALPVLDAYKYNAVASTK